MTLNPRENFAIVRQIEDHTDSATYYVRAVIRNAKTDAVISVDGNAYLNLVDRGDRRFSQNWLVPADPSGQGFYVSILTSVYTDSGYTTKSQNYGDKIDIYLIQDRLNANLGGVGGGSDIDYKKIREILKDELKKLELEIPEAKVVESVKEVVQIVKVPEIKIIEKENMANLSPIIDEIKRVGQLVIDKEVTEVEEVNLKPLMESINRLNNLFDKRYEYLFDKINSMKFELNIKDLLPKVEERKEPEMIVVRDPRITKLIKSK